MKKFFSLALALALLVSPASAFADTTINEALKLDLNKAISTGLENNQDFKLIDKKISIAESDVRLANANVDFYKNKYYETGAERQANAKKAYLLPVQKLNALDKLKRDKTEKIKSVKSEIIEKYNALVKSEMSLASLKKTIEISKKELENKQMELKLGKVTQLDVDKIEVKYDQARLDVAKAEDSNKSIEMELNNTLGLPLMTDINITLPELTIKDFKVQSPADIFKAYMVNQNSIKGLEANISELELEIKVIQENSGTSLAYDNSASTEVDDLKTTLNQTKVELKNKNITLEYDFYKQMRAISNQLEDVNIAKVNLDISLKDQQIAKAKYALGKVDSLTYLQINNSVSAAQEAYNNAIIAYNQAVELFKIEYNM